MPSTRRKLALAATAASALAVPLLFLTLRGRAGEALAQLGSLSPVPVWGAGVGFLVALVCSGGAWRCALAARGTRLGLVDSCCRYGAGSLANSVLPGGAGEAVRLGLFARAVGGTGAAWTASGTFAAIGLARLALFGVLAVAAALTNDVPVPPLLLVPALAVPLAVAVFCRHRTLRRCARLLETAAALARDPRSSLRLFAWLAGSFVGRLAAAALIVSALHIPHPLQAALAVLVSVALAEVVPLLPANLGVAGAAVALALQHRGVPETRALAAGIALQAIQTLVGIGFGGVATLLLAPACSPRASRWVLRCAAGLVCLAGTCSALLVVPFP